jgi:hypothetical protein
VSLSRADSSVPFKRWQRATARSSRG